MAMRADPDSDKLPDSIADGRERERRFRAESLQRQAEQAEQEQRQRDRQARHEAQARRIDEETRAALFMRVMQAREEKPAEVPPIPLSTQRQDEELAAEQEAGRRALARYAQRNAPAAVDAGKKAEETTGLPGFKTPQG
jgi:hypothetical protein